MASALAPPAVISAAVTVAVLSATNAVDAVVPFHAVAAAARATLPVLRPHGAGMAVEANTELVPPAVQTQASVPFVYLAATHAVLVFNAIPPAVSMALQAAWLLSAPAQLLVDEPGCFVTAVSPIN